MRPIYIIVSFLLMSLSASAQQSAEQGMDYSFYEDITSRVHRVNQNLSSKDASPAIISFVRNNINSDIDLAKTFATKSKTGWHYTYAQIYNGIEVYNGELKAHVSNEGNLYLIQENLINTINWGNLSRISEDIPGKVAERFKVNILKQKQVVYVFNNAPVVAWQLITHSDINYQTYEYIVDENLQVLYYRDRKKYFTTPPDSLVKAKVFLPDPVTTAKVVYGDPYLDWNDSNVAEVNAQRVDVELRVKYEFNTFYLENDLIAFGNVSPPTNETSILSATPEFYYGRGDDEFEFVNSFYHVDVIMKYVTGLGYGDLVKFVRIDPHAQNGGDQSSFDGDIVPPALEFGDGGVDDAEDADVIIHEFCHSLCEYAAPNTFVGQERQGMEEGLCDYFAVSYSRFYSDFNWQNTFNWDGHNQYWNGRNAKTKKTYPDGLNGDIHKNGEIFASALMESFGLIGREKMDAIFIESLYFLAKNQTMPQFAQIMIDVDGDINNGDNYTQLMLGFAHRKLLDWGVSVPKVNVESNVLLQSSYDFANGTSPAIFNAVNTKLNSVIITDALGKVVYRQELNGKSTISISPNNFVKGIYFVNVITPNKDFSFKLVRY